MKINDFELDLNVGSAPFFQTNGDKRVRFLMDTFADNPGLLKKVYKYLIEINDDMNCSFISGYMFKDRKQFEYGNIGRTIKITNVKTCSYWNNDLDAFVTFSTVTNVASADVHHYLKKSMRGFQHDLHICFYNKDFLIYVTTDVMDLISTKRIMAGVKQDFASFIDRRYEGSADMI